MPHTIITPTSIGSMAWQILAQAQQGTVWGVTSRGVFLHLPAGWVVFLSTEPFRGPLTLNISALPPDLQNAKPGMQVEIQPDRLHFASLNLAIQIHTAPTWSAPPPPQAVNAQPAAISFRLSAISHQLLAVSDQPFVNSYLLTANGSTLIAHLGLGGGLTPAGDDLALGFLLAINRWQALLCPDFDVQAFNQEIVQAACARTNTLSANLITCAASGQADERLIWALDGIITGAPEPDPCVAYLSGWGSSSGASAFQGMALAIKRFLANPKGFEVQTFRVWIT